VNVVLRILGLNVLAHVGSRLPSRAARTTTSIILIAANLLPLLAVLNGAAGLGDVFVVYWFENVVVWFTTTIKILTARGADESQARKVQMSGNVLVAAFFTFHFGLFTLVHGVFSFTLARLTGGLTGEPSTWLLLMLAILVSHLISLGLNWFGQGERDAATVRRAMAMPYPRMLVLHVSVLAAFFLLLGFGDMDGANEAVAPVALLCGLKTALDVAFHLRERAANRRIADAQDGEAAIPG
jgi:hypothetical protein